VFISWENEALLVTQQLAKDRFDVVTPSVSILAEPPVAIVDRVVDKRGSRELAQVYLEFLYGETGQEIAAKHFYRPRLAAVAARHKQQFQQVGLFTIEEVFGGWQNAQKTHFGDGAVFDQIYQPGR
jgi:sulfate transport system substrate-binding protein